MIRLGKKMKKTVFVLGAGASKEVGLPVGAELKRNIAEILNIRFKRRMDQISGDSEIARALHLLAKGETPPSLGINPYLEVAQKIREGMPINISIDNFIDLHSSNERLVTCGKLAIVSSILNAEASSTLKVDRKHPDATVNFSKIEDTWYVTFFQLLTENCKREDLKNRLSLVVLVIFNYDRCFEQFLLSALRKTYFFTDVEAMEYLRLVKIFHPYGSVGSPNEWGTPQGVDFGTKPDATNLIPLHKQIKTFTEGTIKDTGEVLELRTHVRTAHRVVFLGFAYHRLNIDLLAPDSQRNKELNQEVYGSALAISDSDTSKITALLTNRLNARSVQLHNELTCAGLLNEYRRSLSMV
jgi:hypothetical protein